MNVRWPSKAVEREGEAPAEPLPQTPMPELAHSLGQAYIWSPAVRWPSKAGEAPAEPLLQAPMPELAHSLGPAYI